ncbi:phytanoyl-CoA dioxygenase family protein [Candidatus Pelagibacter sp.]|nr:phytanoyl-CoA dioxygenase family protein [Candidatus Pelagibacter sp.]
MNSNFAFQIEKKYISEEDVEKLSILFNKHFEKTDEYHPKEHIIQLNPNKKDFDTMLKFIRKKIEMYFKETHSFLDVKLEKEWFVKTQSRHVDMNNLPYIAHFDKHRYLKAMVYLDNVTIDHGPIYLGRVSNPLSIEKRRKSLQKDYKIHGMNNITAKDIVRSMEPMNGNSGDVIFFDTNTAHHAGIVSEGFERRVIRFDFDVASFKNHSSILKKILNYLFS